MCHALTQPDTNTIKQAEAALKPLLKNPEVIPLLFTILTNSTGQNFDVGTRQMASILIKKRVGGHYSKYPADAQSQLKAGLLNFIGVEPERLLRRSTVGIIGVIAGLDTTGDLPTGKCLWPEVFQFISNNLTTPNCALHLKEVAYLLLQEMTLTIGEHLPSLYAPLSQLYLGTLNDPDANPDAIKVKNAALTSLGQLMSYLSDDEGAEGQAPPIRHFVSLIPVVLQTADTCRARQDEDTLQVINDVIFDLVNSPLEEITQFIPHTIQFCMNVIADGNLDLTTRDGAALVITSVAESRPKLFGRKCGVENLVECFLHLIEVSEENAAGAFFESNPAWKEDAEDSDDDEDYDGPSQVGIAQGCLDTLALNLPQKYIFKCAMHKIVDRMKSPDPRKRKSGVASLGVIGEGCAEKLQEHLAEIMPLLLAAGRDQDMHVRECACFALSQFAEFCQPEVINYAEDILGVVFMLLDDQSVNVQTTSCYVLEMFCEHLQPSSITAILDSLVKKLVRMLEGATRKCVREMAIAAISAVAIAAEEKFVDYLEGVSTIMVNLMVSLVKEDQAMLKGRAMECMGHMAIAVGKDAFRPYFNATFTQCASVLTQSDTTLHEYAIAVFANLAKVMGKEFSPALPELVPHLCKVLSEEDNLSEEQARSQGLIEGGGPGGGGQLSALDDSDEEDGDGEHKQIYVRTGLLEVKKQAICALGEMANYCEGDFMPYLPQTMEMLQKNLEYFFPDIVEEAVNVLPSLVVCSVAANHGEGGVGFVNGVINPVSEMSAHSAEVCEAVMQELMKKLCYPEIEIVNAACRSIQAVLELCGPHAVAKHMNDLLQELHTLSCGKSECQQELGDDDEDEEDEDEEDHDSNYVPVMDLVGALARVFGGHFAQFLPQFLPPIVNFCKPSRPTNDRSMGMGAIAELAEGCGEGILPHYEQVFFPLIMQGLGDSEVSVQRNSAFACGHLCLALGDKAANQYPQFMQSLYPLFNIDVSGGDSSAACRDNAVGAIARMMTACPQNCPFGQILPIFFKCLPLINDQQENDAVYTCIVKLAKSGLGDLGGVFKEEVLRVVKAAMGLKEKDIDADLLTEVKGVFGVV
mgnify:CR=1 FL=1